MLLHVHLTPKFWHKYSTCRRRRRHRRASILYVPMFSFVCFCCLFVPLHHKYISGGSITFKHTHTHMRIKERKKQKKSKKKRNEWTFFIYSLLCGRNGVWPNWIVLVPCPIPIPLEITKKIKLYYCSEREEIVSRTPLQFTFIYRPERIFSNHSTNEFYIFGCERVICHHNELSSTNSKFSFIHTHPLFIYNKLFFNSQRL